MAVIPSSRVAIYQKRIAGKVELVAYGSSANLQENYETQDIKVLGDILAKEIPTTGFSGTFSCNIFPQEILADSGIPNVGRYAKTREQWSDEKIFVGDEELEISIWIRRVTKKAVTSSTPSENKLGEYTYKEYAKISKCTPTSLSVSVSVGGILTLSQSFKIIVPTLYDEAYSKSLL